MEQSIEKMRESNWIDNSLYESLRSMMLQYRQYSRTDYLVHAKEYSTNGDHCWS